jgi:hypothetical protein
MNLPHFLPRPFYGGLNLGDHPFLFLPRQTGSKLERKQLINHYKIKRRPEESTISII